MNLLFWGLTISVIGKVLLVIGILKAHGKIVQEQKIDLQVLHTFHTEKMLTILGLIFILIGYALEIYFYGLTQLLTCVGIECSGAIGSILTQ